MPRIITYRTAITMRGFALWHRWGAHTLDDYGRAGPTYHGWTEGSARAKACRGAAAVF